MSVQEFLRRLEKVRKTPDGWVARCPAHEDGKPSLSIGVGEDGRILLHCFAGCSVAAIVTAMGLELSDLFPSGSAPRASRQDAADVASVSSVARWLADRCIDRAEIERLGALETPRGAVVVFPYRDGSGQLVYSKYRPIAEKTFWRKPSGRRSLLYGLDLLEEADHERAIVVEGELDVHALRTLGFDTVVSVPDGSGSELTDELLAPLAPFRRIVIATDADVAGDKLASRLTAALGEERCVRARFTGAGIKDANDALRAGWTRDRVEQLIEAAIERPEYRRRPADRPLGFEQYDVEDGRICQLRRDREGNSISIPLANFDARIEEQVTRDDGAERAIVLTISGRLASGAALPRVEVMTSEFPTMSWVLERWGAQAVIGAGSGTKDHLRAAIQGLSTPDRRRVFCHTGWRELEDGHQTFLYQGGALGAEDVSVHLDPPLDRFRLPARADDVREAVNTSLDFLSCAPLHVTVPLLGAVYLAPLASILRPDFVVWLFGPTGSFKTELATLAQRHFGDFTARSLPAGWSCTEATLETRLFRLKDVLVVIDDFAPQADPRAQRLLDTRVENIVRSVGNHSARGRMRSDLTLRPDRPPRGVVLCTGEDLPRTHSINARTVAVEVFRDDVDREALTSLQARGGRFAHAMRGYLEYLLARRSTLADELPRTHLALRERFLRLGGHARQPSALAFLCLGIELFLDFAVDCGAVELARSEELCAMAVDALGAVVRRQSDELTEMDPAEVFLTILRELLAQGRAQLLPRDRAPCAEDVGVVGWKEGERAFLISQAARELVASSAARAGMHWNLSPAALSRALLHRGYLHRAADGHLSTQVRAGAGVHRVLDLPLPILLGDSVTSTPSPISPVSTPTGDDQESIQQLELP